jgi:hypothetical protein
MGCLATKMLKHAVRKPEILQMVLDGEKTVEQGKPSRTIRPT